MKAIYIGENGAQGFIKGNKYYIKSKVMPIIKSKHNIELQGKIYIYDTNSMNWCPYDSVEEMMKEWKFI